MQERIARLEVRVDEHERKIDLLKDIAERLTRIEERNATLSRVVYSVAGALVTFQVFFVLYTLFRSGIFGG